MSVHRVGLAELSHQAGKDLRGFGPLVARDGVGPGALGKLGGACFGFRIGGVPDGLCCLDCTVQLGREPLGVTLAPCGQVVALAGQFEP